MERASHVHPLPCPPHALATLSLGYRICLSHPWADGRTMRRVHQPYDLTTSYRTSHAAARRSDPPKQLERSHTKQATYRVCVCPPRHCTKTVVRRARCTRWRVVKLVVVKAEAAALSAHSSASILAVERCLVGCVCTVPQGAQLRAAGQRAAHGGGTARLSPFHPTTTSTCHTAKALAYRVSLFTRSTSGTPCWSAG